MIKKVTMLFIILGTIISCDVLEKNKKLELKDIKDMTFITSTKNGDIIYTTNNETYKISKLKEMKLENKIVEKIQNNKEEYYIIENSEKKGLLDKKFRKIEDLEYEKIENIGKDYILGSNGNEKYLVNLKNKEIFGSFDEVYSFGLGELIKTVKDEKISYKTNNGKDLPKLDNHEIFYYKDNTVIFRDDSLYGLYNIVKDRYIPAQNEEIYFSNENLLVRQNGEYYFNGEKLDIKRVIPSTNDVIICEVEKGFKLFNLKDGKFNDELFNEIAPNYDRDMIIGKNGKYTIKDKYSYDNLKDYEYDFIERVGKNSFAVGKDTTGMFSLVIDNKKITDEIYDGFFEINQDYYFGMLDNKYDVIDKDGNKILEFLKKDLVYYNRDLIIVREEGVEYAYPLKEKG